jgi:type IV pilus assembly protein PilO
MKVQKIMKKKLKTRELTKNEKFLLSILGIILVVWGSYRFIIAPQAHKLSTLNAQKLEYQEKIDEINFILRKEETINKEWDILHKEKEDIISRYFPKLDQAQIIYLLNDLVEKDSISAVDMNFNRPSYEDIGDFQVKNMDISVPYKGDYTGVVDIIRALKNSPRKILLDSLTIDRDNEGKLNGNICLRVYSLDGIADTDNDIVYIDTEKLEQKITPFSPYKDYTDSIIETGTPSEEIVEIKEVNPYIEETLLDFENRNTFFLPSQDLVKGNVEQSTKSKSKKYALRFEYNIVAVEEENRGFIDITRSNINLKYPPNSIGLWVYSYDYSPATIGLNFKGQMGEDILVPISEGISWTGWKYIETTSPEDISLYPLKLEKIYLEIPKNREDYGVILIDKLQALYERNLDEDGKDVSIGNYTFHVVKEGDTIDKISNLYYGNTKYKNEILKLNELKASDELPIGKVLVLKKR